jgi:hypothetical protein
MRMHWLKLLSRKMSLVHPLDGYYSFNLYHMQSAFYLLWMGWCLSALCFFGEVFYNRFLSRKKWKLVMGVTLFNFYFVDGYTAHLPTASE